MRAPGSLGIRAGAALALLGSLVIPFEQACDGSVLDLGASDAAVKPSDASDGTGDTESGPQVGGEQRICPPITVGDYAVLRGQTCLGICTDDVEPPRRITSAIDLAAALAGRWGICSGSLGSSDVGIVEFKPDLDCVVSLLLDDGTPAYAGTFDVVTQSDEVTGIELHLPTGSLRVSVSANSCLGRARLGVTSLVDGGGDESIELAALPRGGTINPEKKDGGREGGGDGG